MISRWLIPPHQIPAQLCGNQAKKIRLEIVLLDPEGDRWHADADKQAVQEGSTITGVHASRARDQRVPDLLHLRLSSPAAPAPDQRPPGRS
jgi:hypothetical protein